MIILNNLGKNVLMYLVFYEFYRSLCGCTLFGSKSSTNDNQTQPEEPKDPYKTTFDGDLINLDINCLHGYTKFECKLENTKVTYQSNCFFKKVSDGDLKLWEATNKNAFRVTLQLLDTLFLTAQVELDRGNDDTASFYLRKYNSSEWEKCDKKSHNQRIEEFLKALKSHKENIDNQTKDAIDLCLTLKNNEHKLEINEYKAKDKPVSSKTAQAKLNNHQIDTKEYTVTDIIKETKDKAGNSQSRGQSTASNTELYGVENPQKHLVFEMKPKYRIVKLKYDQGTTKPTLTIWETGGYYYIVKVVAIGDSDRYTVFVLEILDSETGKRKQHTYRFKENEFYKRNEFKMEGEKMLPRFDFKY